MIGTYRVSLQILITEWKYLYVLNYFLSFLWALSSNYLCKTGAIIGDYGS